MLDLDPEYSKAADARAQIQRTLQQRETARASDNKPASAVDWVKRGHARKKNSNFDGAIDAYSRAIEIDENSFVPWFNRGLARQGNGDLDGAIADWQRFLELAPNHELAPGLRASLQKALQQR